jgi:hypothetical protein
MHMLRGLCEITTGNTQQSERTSCTHKGHSFPEGGNCGDSTQYDEANFTISPPPSPVVLLPRQNTTQEGAVAVPKTVDSSAPQFIPKNYGPRAVVHCRTTECDLQRLIYNSLISNVILSEYPTICPIGVRRPTVDRSPLEMTPSTAH